MSSVNEHRLSEVGFREVLNMHYSIEIDGTKRMHLETIAVGALLTRPPICK
jgi:hypothetical protein